MGARRAVPFWATPLLLAAVVMAGLVMSRQSTAEPISPTLHKISMMFDPDSGRIEVENTFPLTGEDLVFDLAPWIEVIEARGGAAPIETVRIGESLRIPAQGPSVDQITLILRGVVPGLNGPDAGGALQTATASPEGSYLSGYAGWMAPVGPGRAHYRLTIEVPAAYRAVATGYLESEEFSGDTYRAVFRSEEPGKAPTVFVGPYFVKERMDDSLRLRTYFHPEHGSLAEDYLESSIGYIRRYAELIGPYPYSGFSVVSAPVPVGFGFNSLTYVSRRILPLPFMRGRSLAHEILHNWWGSGIAVDYERGNWAEGLTTYMADYALAEDNGELPAREMRLEWLRNLAALPENLETPVVGFVSKTHDRTQVVGYDKTALIFHMLRREIGDIAFAEGLRLFWRAHRFQVAAWPDLQHAFEEAAGRDLGWFFGQWLARAGLPRIDLGSVRRRETGSGFDLILTLRQISPHYRLRLPVVIETAGGSKRFDLLINSPEETFSIPLAQRPQAVHIDSGFDVARRLLSGESPPILRNVTLSEDALVIVPSPGAGVSQAAEALAGRLLQRKITILPEGDFQPARRPLLIIGLRQDVEAFRARFLSAQLDAVAGEGTARSWTEEGPEGVPWLFVSADSLDALERVLGPLPHYRNRSFVVFNDRKAIRQGLWPVRRSPLSYRFE